MDDLDACIRDEDFHPAEAFDGSRNAGIYGLFMGLHPWQCRLPLPVRHRSVSLHPCGLEVEVGNHRFCALFDESFGDGGANAAGRIHYNG